MAAPYTPAELKTEADRILKTYTPKPEHIDTINYRMVFALAQLANSGKSLGDAGAFIRVLISDLDLHEVTLGKIVSLYGAFGWYVRVKRPGHKNENDTVLVFGKQN